MKTKIKERERTMLMVGNDSMIESDNSFQYDNIEPLLEKIIEK